VKEDIPVVLQIKETVGK